MTHSRRGHSRKDHFEPHQSDRVSYTGESSRMAKDVRDPYWCDLPKTHPKKTVHPTEDEE